MALFKAVVFTLIGSGSTVAPVQLGPFDDIQQCREALESLVDDDVTRTGNTVIGRLRILSNQIQPPVLKISMRGTCYEIYKP